MVGSVAKKYGGGSAGTYLGVSQNSIRTINIL